nr:hypothetical protein [Tanacetum cinerariifolium]
MAAVEDFQDSPDDKEDTRSSHEYLNDLEEEYQARGILAKYKRFFKKGNQSVGNKMLNAFPLPVMSSHCQKTFPLLVKNGSPAETFGINEATRKTKKNQLKQQYGNFKAERKETLEQTFNRLQAIRNRSDLDTMSLDDLYNHLKVYEPKVQKKSDSHNMAFISSVKNSNGNGEVNTASIPTAITQVSPTSANVTAASISLDTACAYMDSQSNGSQIKYEDINQIDEDDTEEMEIKWNMALLSMRADRFWKKTGKKISIHGTNMAGFDKSKVECFNCHKMGHFARECKAPRIQDRGRRENYKQENEEENHALVADEEAPTEFALMAKSSSDNEVEARQVEFKNQEIKFCEKIRGLEFKVESKTNRIESLTNELEMLKKEKEEVDSKLTGFQSASKDLDNFLGSQRSDKNKEGLGCSVVPPLLLKPTPSIESNSNDLQNNSSSVSENGESTSSILSKPEIKFVKAADSPTGIKTMLGDNGCSQHMTGNISYLSDYEPYDGGYVSFGQGGYKITSKGTIKTDESMLWHRRLGHLNFKTINRLVSYNLVKGLPSKCFDNDHTCVACLKGKQHKASCKTKLVNSVSKPLHTLHMDLFGPTSDETSGILRNFTTEIENLKDLKNEVTKRRNRTLIEAARTMLADAKLPVTFWVEVVNTTCYVQNMVLVNKSQNKTPYELFNGRTPAIGFLKPFGCHVMILNTLDNLEKFDAKGDEGYFIGYSMSSKAFRVFNKRTKRVKENLHVDFLENKLIKKRAGPNWLFDIDTLTNSMNYVPVVSAGTTSTNFSGTREAASQDVKKDVSSLRYIALLNWFHEAHLETSTSNAQDACKADAPESSRNSNPTATSTNPLADQMKTLTVETPIPTVSSPVLTACLDDSPKPSSDTRLISKRVTSQEDTQSLDIILNLSNRFEDILGVTTNTDDTSGVEANLGNMEYNNSASPTLTFRIHKDHPKKPKNISDALKDPSWVEAMHEELLQFKIQNVWTLVDCPKGVRPIGINGGPINKYSHRQEESWGKDETVTPKECHLHAVKRIFRYLKGHPKLGLWYPKESPFELVAYSDSDYGGATQDRKSTSRGCQFLGRRLISWQCKKQTIVATSTTEAEYVAAASGCGQVLWIQNQLLDYGHHFIRDCFEKKLISVDHIHTDDNVADLLTKPFDAGREFEALMHEKFQMSAMGELNFFLGMQVLQKKDDIFLSQDKYVGDILKKFGYSDVRSANTPMDKENPWGKDGTDKDVDLHLYRSMIGSLMYLTASRPDIIDYGGATQDWKSTTGGCQFLGRRLISWQCKKQIIVATSTTEAEYVAAVSGCGQVLWIQNHLLDYGHHFIRDYFEKKLISVDHIHTYDNVTDLLTKPFDAGRFQYLVVEQAMRGSVKGNHIIFTTIGEGSGTPTGSHHTPSPEAQQSLPTAPSSPSLPPATTETIPTVIPSDIPTLRQYYKRAKIAQSSALPTAANEPDRENIIKTSALPHDSPPRVTSLAADEGSLQQKLHELTDLCTRLQRQQTKMASKIAAQDLEITSLKARITLLEDKDGGVAEPSGEDAIIKGRSLETGEEACIEKSTERGNVATVSVPTGSGLVPTASLIFTTASVVTPYSRRKGKEKMVESDTLKKKKLQEQIDVQVAREMEEQMAREDQRRNEQIAKDAEITRIHAEEEL